MNKKKILISLGAIVAVIAGVVGMAAFEAHVINVTAHIENALDVPVSAIDFGTVFPQEKFDKDFSVSLSNSFKDTAACGTENLVGNGSFEFPVVTNGAGWDIFSSNTSGLNWVVDWVGSQTSYGNLTRPAPALQEFHRGVNGWLPQDGNQYTELDSDWDGPNGSSSGEPALVKIYQNIPTTPGNKYKITFYYSPRPGTSAAENSMDVNWDNNSLDTISADGSSNSNTVWTMHSYEVTATSNSTRLEFVGKGTDDSLGNFLDNVNVNECGRVASVDYVLKQKPKCMRNESAEQTLPPYGTVVEDGNAFVCADTANYTLMPLLCPFLSKHETTTDGTGPDNDGKGIDAFHGPLNLADWTSTVADDLAKDTTGKLSVPAGDLNDNWNIDLHTPCFNGMCDQDALNPISPEYIPPAYQLDPSLNGQTFGCDLWLEVTGIDGVK